MENSDLLASIDKYWEQKIVPTISTYIEIPAKSPNFDPQWRENGHLHAALKLVEKWIEEQKVPGLKKEVIESGGRTPLLLLEIPGTYDYQVLMYGHLDKQPEMTGWAEGLGPWKAVRRGEKLYGRGGSDDGYAVFASVCAIQHLIENKSPRPHIRVAIEFSEESGSSDLPYYFETQSQKFGTPNLVICLDSGAGNYEQFWTTTSLRGLVNGELRVDVLTEGVHSGYGSGIAPSSFRIMRQLLNRIENVETGEVLLKSHKVEVPEDRKKQIKRTSEVIGGEISAALPFVKGAKPTLATPEELTLNRTWRAALSVVGSEGMPEPQKAGNVLRPFTTLKLSMRLPPTADAEAAAAELKQVLESNPPYGAKVELKLDESASGWNAPTMSPALENLLQEASMKYYQKEALAIGEGGTIPFMGMLGRKFPKAQFVVTGVLGPNSNAHGPNEFLHIEFAKKLTACITHVLANAQQLS